MKLLRIVLVAALTVAMAVAKTRYPAPLLYQPLIPATVKPGSGQFQLTVHGFGFATTAVVTWNGATRITSFISNSELQVQINAADVASAGTASVAVVNPTPGGGTSNIVFFPVQTPGPTATLVASSNFSSSGVNVSGDFNNDGILDLASASSDGSGFYINTYLGNGDGTFQPPYVNHSITPIAAMVTGDFNGDGLLDIGASDGWGNTTIFLNHGNGVFVQRQVFRSAAPGMAVGDFNGDGILDLFTSGIYAKISLGVGDGTFGPAQLVDYRGAFGVAAVGDFNGDGKLDVAMPGGDGIEVFLGNGDGTFGSGTSYRVKYPCTATITADVNGDGILDIITNGFDVLLGNGDGSFTDIGGYQVGLQSFVVPRIGDFNGDGNLDVAVATAKGVELFLGRGNGTFRDPIPSGDSAPGTLALGDFNQDGKLDLVGIPLYLQAPILLSPAKLKFGTQNVGTKSKPLVATALNVGNAALPFNGITFGGNDTKDFSETDNCGTSLPVGGTCRISVTFEPNSGGPKKTTMNFNYQGFGSPQTVTLEGVGAVSTVTLMPSKLDYSGQLIGTTSSPQTATLTNTGTVPVTISSITASAQFSETNNCPSSLPLNGSCQIQVQFTPTQSGEIQGTLLVTDDAKGSPQAVALSGIGVAIKLSPPEINFGDQQVGTQSNPAPVQLTNLGSTTVTIQKIFVGGKDSGDFSQTNNCGTSVPPGGSCQINVTFAPVAKGERTANLEVEDNGGGSPQKMQLTGTGT